MKTTTKQYELFKDECRKWIEKFHLNDYDVYFKWEDIDEADACSEIQGGDGNITITLNKNINFIDRDPTEDIKETAKHEIIHCLIGRYVRLAKNRYVSGQELDYEEEHLVRKLCKII